MKRFGIIVFALLVLACTLSAKGKKGKKIKIETTQDSVSYSIGVSMGESLLQTDIDNINQELFFRALKSKMDEEPTLWNHAKSDSILMHYIIKKREAKALENKKRGEEFLEENAKREGVFTTESGLQYEILEHTEGERPSLNSTVKCLYQGKNLDGEVFDSALDPEYPLEFRVTGMIDGWVEALQMMPIGSKWRLFIPSNLAYGEQGAGGRIGANEALIFDVELLEIVK